MPWFFSTYLSEVDIFMVRQRTPGYPHVVVLDEVDKSGKYHKYIFAHVWPLLAVISWVVLWTLALLPTGFTVAPQWYFVAYLPAVWVLIAFAFAYSYWREL